MQSLTKCDSVIFTDDELNVLKVGNSTDNKNGEIDESNDYDKHPIVQKAKLFKSEHEKLKQSLTSNKTIHSLLEMTLTLDQAKVLLKMLNTVKNCSSMDQISNFDPNNKNSLIPKTEIVFLTAARGRGKTVGLALAVCGALLLRCSNIFVSAPSAQNLNVLFSFIEKGLIKLGFKKNLDFHLKADSEGNSTSLELFLNKSENGDLNQEKKFYKHTVTYINPIETTSLLNCDLLVIDEAASIPVEYVERLIIGGNYPSFISSTVHGYEGTGRSLSLKLVQKLRGSNSGSSFNKNQKVFRLINEIKMELPIRYGLDDK